MLPWLRKRRLRPVLNRSNDEWLEALRGEDREQAIADLREVLLIRLRATLRRRVRSGSNAFAEDIAQEAVLRILDSLDTFRGESRFLTWAQKIATRLAISELRRKRWSNVSLDDVTSPGSELPLMEVMPSKEVGPEEQAAQSNVLEIVMGVIRNDLTDRQQQAIEAIMFNDMSIEVFAERIGSNRNAVYKLLHDARKRIKAALEARGIDVDDLV
ncbi:RNA polymerase sigma factor [soil metagenome]